MRLIQLHDELWDSGLAHYALTLAGELKRRGHELRFWAKAGSWAYEKARSAGLATRQIRRPWAELPALRRELRAFKAELVNAHTGSSHSLAAALSAGIGFPLVRTRADARAAKTHALARVLARRTAAFVAAHGGIARELSSAFPDARVEIIPQGIEPLTGGALPSEPNVGILGRLDPVKGHADLASALARVPGARVLAAGSGRQLSELQATLRQFGVEGRFELLGFVDDLPAFIARCRLAVVASRGSEAVSRAALEWMSAGRPLIATTVGCLPELVEDGVTGRLVPPQDPAKLAAAIEDCLAAPARAEQWGRAGRARYEKLYTVAGFAERTETLYRELLSK